MNKKDDIARVSNVLATIITIATFPWLIATAWKYLPIEFRAPSILTCLSLWIFAWAFIAGAFEGCLRAVQEKTKRKRR